MKYDYCKLIGKIVEKFRKQYAFANAIGWSERTCCLKLSSQREWKQSEIITACELLDISKSDVYSYFFTLQVQ